MQKFPVKLIFLSKKNTKNLFITISVIGPHMIQLPPFLKILGYNRKTDFDTFEISNK